MNRLVVAAPVLVVMLTGALGCTADTGTTAGAPVRQTLVVDLEIGTADGADPYVFGSPGGVAMDGDGRIYVADTQASAIRVFAADGTHLYTIGRQGAGPGELSRPCCLTFDREGRLWTRDIGNARYNAYRPGPGGAAWVAQVRMAHGDPNYGASLTFDGAGRLVDVGHRAAQPRGPRSLYRHHLDSDGVVSREHAVEVPGPDALGAYAVEYTTPQGSATSFVYPPYGVSHLVAHAPNGGWAEAVSSQYEVTWYDDAGAARVIRRPDVSGPAISAAERTAAEERLASQLQAVGAAPGDARFRVPDRKQPIAALFFDQAGRLWVQRSVADGAMPVADVHAANGELVMEVSWPRGVQLSRGWIEQDRALGFRQDELGTPQVVRLTFTQTPD